MAIVSTFPEKRGLNTDDINDIANGEISNGFIQSQFNYSIEEQIIGKWIDGKPIYQKTIDCGYLLDTNRKTVPHNIPNIDKIVEFKAFTYSSSGDFRPFPYVWFAINQDPVWKWCNALTANKTDIIIVTYGDRTSEYAYVTLQYTKTTD